MAQVIAVATQEGGMPIPRGGGAKLAEALVQLIRDFGGACETGTDVERVLVGNGRAGGRAARRRPDRHGGARGDLQRHAHAALRAAARPAAAGARRRRGAAIATGAARCRSTSRSRSGLAGKVDERLGKTAILHVTPGLDGVSRAVNEAERGLLPAEATIVCGQPMTMDETRAPDGKWIIWIQLQELPRQVKGDAAGLLDTGDGTWTESLRERYADRIVERLARHAPNLESSILKRVVLSPADLEAANINLAGGDPYSGALSLDQNFLWRPFPQQPGHRTQVEGLYHIGASTHPGPGLGGGSGFLVAHELLESRLDKAKSLFRR